MIGSPARNTRDGNDDLEFGLAVAADPLLRLVGDVEVVGADDHVEVAAGVDVAAAAFDSQPGRPSSESIRGSGRP